MENRLVYCGFGVYADVDSGKTFEKKADNTLSEVDNEQTKAEQRFVNRHLDDNYLGGENNE
jgi:hypothetical protein